MQQQVQHRQVFEMGQIGQMKTESISGRGVQKSFREYVSYVPHLWGRADGAARNRKSGECGVQESSRNYVSYVPLRGVRGTLGHIISGVSHEISVQKVPLLCAPCVPPLFIKFGIQIFTSHGGI